MPSRPQASSRRANPEEQLHRAIAVLFHTVLAPDVIALHCPNGERRDKVTAARLKAMGVLPGVADWLIAWPAGVLWLELKSEKGRLSDAQRAFADRVLAIGHGFEECRSIDDVLSVLKAYGVPMRAKVRAA